MASNPNNPRSFRDRLWRGVTIGTIGTLGITGIAACSNGEAQAEKPPVTQSAEPTPGPTKSAPVETQKPIESLVGAIDTTNLAPAAVELAKKTTPELLAAMSAEDRVSALAITPEMYNGDTEILADLQLVQFGAMVGLASDEGFVDGLPRIHEEWIAFGNNFMDSVYGSPVSESSEKAAAQFAFVAMRTTSIIDGRKIATSPKGQNVPGFKIVFSKAGKSETVGGNTVMNSADIVTKVRIDAPVDYSALPNDPYIADPNSPGMGNGLPTSETDTLVFSDVLERDGTVVPTSVILSK